MHDCNETKARLIDLVFGEAADAERLRAEVESCPACRAEHAGLRRMLRAFDGAAAAAEPPEDFWPGYHARLSDRLRGPDAEPRATRASSAAARRARADSWWRRALTATWHVPAPACVAALLALILLAALALRRPPAPITSAAPGHAATPEQRQVIEVPVVQEKIVVRTIYVTRRTPQAVKRSKQPPQPEGESLAVRGRDDGGPRRPAPLALTGFRPAEDVNLRVIKGGYKHEK